MPKKVIKNIINLILEQLSKIQYIYRFFEIKIHQKIFLSGKYSIKIIPPLKSLAILYQHIESEKQGAYMRFGDGDAFLANMQHDLFQQSSFSLSQEMQEAFSLSGENIFKSLSIHSEIYGYEKEMYIGNHLVSEEYANNLLKICLPYFIGTPIYSPIALHYAACYQIEEANSFLKLLKSKCILFVGNEEISQDIITTLFGTIPIVKTPYKDAYSEIDRISNQVEEFLSLQNNKYGVIVVAMGCSGRPLMKRILKSSFDNIFLFDFGSLLDGIAGENTRTWLREEQINYGLLLKDL